MSELHTQQAERSNQIKRQASHLSARGFPRCKNRIEDRKRSQPTRSANDNLAQHFRLRPSTPASTIQVYCSMWRAAKSAGADVLSAVKTSLEIANTALVPFPVLQTIPAISLKLISLYEETKASSTALNNLGDSLHELHRDILSPILKAKNKHDFCVPPDLLNRVDKLETGLTSIVESLLPLQKLGGVGRVLKRERISGAVSAANNQIKRLIQTFT
ncbi:hypothetical protein DL93DRAFT_2103778, partial [Clavulina sp. PMI_390]